MGYDRLAFFPGNNDTTLISGDKDAARMVYGDQFQRYLGRLGFKTRIVVDRLAVDRHLHAINKQGAEIEELPAITKAEIIPGHPVAPGKFLETKPPIGSDVMPAVLAYLYTHWDPSDAALVLDYSSGKARTIGGI